MKTDLLKIKLCFKFCPYYKPGKKEELACRGFTVTDQLVRRGRKLDFEKYGMQFDKSQEEVLRQKMCLACAFHEQDCDFMLDRTAPPCGGFVLISQLVGSGVIAIEEVA